MARSTAQSEGLELSTGTKISRYTGTSLWARRGCERRDRLSSKARTENATTRRTARGRSRCAARGLCARPGSHALEPELAPRGVHHGRGDLRNPAILGIVGVDLLHHPAHEVGDPGQAPLSVD